MICMATSCKNLVIFGPVTPEFNIAKDVNPSFLFLKEIFLTIKLSQDPPERLSPCFHHMVRHLSITDLTLFFTSLNGRCHGNQF